MREAVTQYARRGDLHIAYQIMGRGLHDLVFVPNWLSNVEANWEVPAFGEFLRGMGSFTRFILFDQLGVGLSDRRAGHGQTLESWAEDLRSVLDAVGSEKATIGCFDAGGAAGLFFAATYPEKVENLVLLNCYARFLRAPDYPAGLPADKKEQYLDAASTVWGVTSSIQAAAPSVADDEEIVSEYARFERMILSPGDLREVFDLQISIDVRDVLPSIRVPTLVLQSKGNRLIRPGHGRYLADHIADAKYVEIGTDDHFFWFGEVGRAVLDEIQEFVTGNRPRIATNRTLTTLLFTDIVASTEHLAKLGDQRWRRLLDRHDDVMRSAVTRYSGLPVKHTGDGFLATFDGPARAVRCAIDATDQMRRLGFEIRSGLHTGEVEIRGEDVTGMAVHIASRIMDQAGASETLASSTVKDLVIGSGLKFDDGHRLAFKGISNEWTVHRVLGT